MLTDKQEKVLQTACSLYEKARMEKKSGNLVNYLQLLNTAFGKLAECIDEVDDIYYQVVFANCIDEMQQEGNVEFNETIQDIKASFYIKAVIWFLDNKTLEFNSYFTAHLFNAFIALGRMYLRGERGVNQNDSAAYACYACIEKLNTPAMTQFVKVAYLSNFIKDTTTDEMIFTGVR